MSAHTSGPWEVRVSGVFLRIVHGKHKTTVADGIVSEAYARLIAAAPELLEALEGLMPPHLSFLPETMPDSATLPLVVTYRELRAARAAIAKARGQ